MTITNLATCWKITLKNKKIMCFTSADQDLVIDGLIYNSNGGFETRDKDFANIQNDYQFIIDLKHDLINKEDIIKGKFDYAEVEVFIVDYLKLDESKINIINGKFSKIEQKDGKFLVNLETTSDNLDKLITKTYSPICRAIFADKECGLRKEDYSFKSVVVKTISAYSFSSDVIKDKDYFKGGIIKFLSGKNKDISYQIKSYEQGEFSLFISTYYELNVGDEFYVTAGCDGYISSCIDKFNNAINFRGEPHVPNIENLFI